MLTELLVVGGPTCVLLWLALAWLVAEPHRGFAGVSRRCCALSFAFRIL